MTELQVTGVDIDGVLKLLGSHLYTSPDVAIRELVQNAHDSIVRRGFADKSAPPGEIRLYAEPARRRLTISDNGMGMSDVEIRDFLATIGAGATREERSSTSSDELLIGMFGVGFLSAFVVGRRVTVETTSFRDPTVGWIYQSSGGRQYGVRRGPASEPGTIVSLELTDDAEALADPEVLQRVTRRYCSLLRVPVYVGDEVEPINISVPWRDELGDVAEHPTEANRRRQQFAIAFERLEPVCTIDVEPSDGCDARGLLWVQGARMYGALDNRNLSVFLRGMLLDDDAKDLLPSWAGFIGGVVESTSLKPTASREDLQRDDHWYALRTSLERQLVDGLAQIASNEPATWRRVLARHNELLLGAAIADTTLFELLSGSLTVPTSEGELRVSDIVQRSHGRIHVGVGPAGGFEETVFRAMKVPIASGARYAVLPFLRRWASERRVDLIELGTARGDRQIFQAVKIDDGDRAWLSEILVDPGDELVPARYAPSSLPIVCVPDREVELKAELEADTADERISRSALSLARAYTATIDGSVRRRVFVNLDSAVVRRLLALPLVDRPQVVVALLRSLKGLTAGSGGGQDLDTSLAEFSAALLELLERN